MNDTEALLSQLRDIQAPEVSIVPALGWWIMLILLVVSMVLLWQMYKRYKSLSWQREARQELAGLRKKASQREISHTLADLSTLVRRVALATRPRAQVASLQGQVWLHELDDICGKPLFSTGYGRLLDQAPYKPETHLDAKDLDAVFDVVEELICSASVKLNLPGSASLAKPELV